ncbi:S8 family serine peptidase [candidate division KSB1 bacterium]|nr:S8 family serine peptidase [candidate division KSB1 bacterium]
MSRNLRFLIAAVCLVYMAFNTTDVFSSDNARLLLMAERLKTDLTANRALALEAAQKNGWPVRVQTSEGAVMELQGIAAGRPVYYMTNNLLSAKTQYTDKVWPGGPLGLQLDGSGQKLGIWDDGAVRADHYEFGGRVRQSDGNTDFSDHATHVAGTMLASGLNLGARGMAHHAELDAYDWNYDLAEMAAAAANGLAISNHSYGGVAGWTYDYMNDRMWVWFGDPAISATEDYKFGYYDASARLVDELLYEAPEYLMVKSAGNDRADTGPSAGTGYWIFSDGKWIRSDLPRDADGGGDGFDTVHGVSVAKNVLTVGAVEPLKYGYHDMADVQMTTFSSWGPTDDGRIKPDVVADGSFLLSPIAETIDAYDRYSGTSMAAPGISGSAALLQQHYLDLNNYKSMLASTLKALIIHTAFEAGNTAGPDYKFGWGLMNTAAAVALITEDSFAPAQRRIHEITLQNGATHEFQLTAEDMRTFKVTICWTDPAGSERPPQLDAPDNVLVNDVDVRVKGPIEGANNTYYPWVLNRTNPDAEAQFGDNNADNVEQVYVPNPTAGTYVVEISHKGTLAGGMQMVSVIVSGHIDSGQAKPEAPALTYPAPNTILASDSTTLKWQGSENAIYNLWISTTDDFSSLYLEEDFLHAPHYLLADLPANTHFYWRVRAKNRGGWGDFSAARRFSTGESGLPVVWQKITPPELDLYVAELEVNHQGHVFASFANSDTTLPDEERIKLCRTKDFGQNWKTVNAFFEPLIINSKDNLFGRSADILGLTDAGKDGTGSERIFTRDIYDPNFLFITEQDRIYMFLLGGFWNQTSYLLRSDDDAKTWTDLSEWSHEFEPALNGFMEFDGALYMGTWGEGIYKSVDDGKTWQSITEGSSVLSVYCLKTTRNGKFITSTLAGLFVSPMDNIQWRRITGGDIEYAKIIDVIVKDHGLIYAISYGCKGPGAGFFASIDHGETWTQVNTGLMHDSPRIIAQGPNNELFIGIGTGDISEGGAVYRGSEEKILQYLSQKLAVTAPVAVTLQNPPQDWYQQQEQITLSWEPVINATAYQMQTSVSSDFVTPIADVEVSETNAEVGGLGGGTHYYWRVRAYNAFGAGPWSETRKFTTDRMTAVTTADDALPQAFALHQNYPNPFNPRTTIAFDLPEPAEVTIVIYDQLGRKVRTLIDGRKQAGRFKTNWDASDDHHQPVAAGVYFCRMKAGAFVKVVKIALVR